MLVGYARTSTTEQLAGLEAQERDLRVQGVERIWKEQTGATGPRKALDEVLDFVREGDVLIVTKLDRLARSVAHLVEIVAKLQARGVSLRILGMGIDTATPTGRLMLNLLGSIAQFEREIMLERQREGIAKAKEDGKYKGRKPTAQAKKPQVLELRKQGLGTNEIARRLGIGKASVSRLLSACSEVGDAVDQAES